MKRFRTLYDQAEWPERLLWLLAALCLGVGVWARFWHLATITAPIFDEVYFPVFASNFLKHITSFDVHPPLGKFFLSIGIAIFGDNSLGWRVVPAVVGLVNITLFASLAQRLGFGRIGMLSVVALTAMDGIQIVYSRVGLIDGILLAAILLTFYVSLLPTTRVSLFWIVTLIGLTASIKWIGLGVLVPIFTVLYVRKSLMALLIGLPWSLVVYESVVTLGQALGKVADPIKAGLLWNGQAAEYHLHLVATHPYASPWWSWPLELRPVLFYYQAVPGGTSVITGLSNPLLWGMVDVAVLASIWFIVAGFLRKQPLPYIHPLYPLLLGYFAFWLPWSVVHRVIFLYHYIPSYAFGLLMVAYWLNRLWEKFAWDIMLLLLVISGFGVYFLPLAIGTPLSDLWLARHVWYRPWIY